MRFLVYNLLRDAGVEVGMGFELKDDVQDVHKQQDLLS